jgi:predicted nucleic acid-binding Zn ribbon protein
MKQRYPFQVVIQESDKRRLRANAKRFGVHYGIFFDTSGKARTEQINRSPARQYEYVWRTTANKYCVVCGARVFNMNKRVETCSAICRLARKNSRTRAEQIAWEMAHPDDDPEDPGFKNPLQDFLQAEAARDSASRKGIPDVMREQDRP